MCRSPSGIGLLELFRWLIQSCGSDFFDMFPLFPFTIIGGVLVQLAAVRFHFEWAVNRAPSKGSAGSRSTASSSARSARCPHRARPNLGPLIILAVASVAWSVFRDDGDRQANLQRNWFEHSIAEFGESQGNVATGFVMVDMVDPARETDVVRGYGYRQLITRPILGGGFVTALAVPLIDFWGSPPSRSRRR